MCFLLFILLEYLFYSGQIHIAEGSLSILYDTKLLLDANITSHPFSAIFSLCSKQRLINGWMDALVLFCVILEVIYPFSVQIHSFAVAGYTVEEQSKFSSWIEFYFFLQKLTPFLYFPVLNNKLDLMPDRLWVLLRRNKSFIWPLSGTQMIVKEV